MAHSEESFLTRRIDAGAYPLAVGDILGISAVLTIGVIFHNGIAYLSTAPIGWGLTILPFLIGWVVISPLIGAYSAGAAESAKAAIPLAIRAWIPASIVGLGLRATPLFDGGVGITFVAVVLITGAIAVTATRWLFFLIIR